MTIHIGFDESGDLGFDFSNKRTSRYFIITFLITANKKPIENSVKRIFKALQKSAMKRSGGILHSHFEKRSTRKAMLKIIAKGMYV